FFVCFFFSSRRRHTRSKRDWSSDVCSSDLTWSDFWAERTNVYDVLVVDVGALRPEVRPGVEARGSVMGLLPEPEAGGVPAGQGRSEERRVGKEGGERGCRGDSKENR